MALALAMMALIEPGDEVIYPDPSFPIYPSFTRGLGAKAVPFGLREENKFQPDLKEIAAKITPQIASADFQFTRIIRPARSSPKRDCRFAELAKKHDLWIIADEIYARILFMANTNPSGRCQEWLSAR